jgi:hypothetical protein
MLDGSRNSNFALRRISVAVSHSTADAKQVSPVMLARLLARNRASVARIIRFWFRRTNPAIDCISAPPPFWSDRYEEPRPPTPTRHLSPLQGKHWPPWMLPRSWALAAQSHPTEAAPNNIDSYRRPNPQSLRQCQWRKPHRGPIRPRRPTHLPAPRGADPLPRRSTGQLRFRPAVTRAGPHHRHRHQPNLARTRRPAEAKLAAADHLTPPGSSARP